MRDKYSPNIVSMRPADNCGPRTAVEGNGIKDFSETQYGALSKRRLLVGLDLLCLFVASIPFFACELKAVSPYRRGFFCGDSSITYPYLEHEVIPDGLLVAGGIVITGLTIALGECYRVRFRGVHSSAFMQNLYVSCLYKELGSFLFGCCVSQSLTNMAKLSVGRLRPHFLQACGVSYAMLNCTMGTYVTTVTCKHPDLDEEARKSFFSGHASFAMYTMLYLAFYLQARLSWRGARLLRPLIQFLLVMLAIYTGLSRISDYRHHPTDVLTGLIQGALTAYWVAFYISTMFKNTQCGSSPQLKNTQCGSSPQIKNTQCGPSPQFKNTQCGSSPQLKNTQCGPSPQFKNTQCGSSPQIKNTQCGSSPQIKNTQSCPSPQLPLEQPLSNRQTLC